MSTREYVDSLFVEYEDTAALTDFKEELRSNLDASIQSLINKGVESEVAFAQAKQQLGDISTLADEFSLKKRQEVFEDLYLGTRKYMKPWRVALYVLCGGVIGFGMIASLLAWFHSGETIAAVASLGTLLPFTLLPIMGLVYLGLTQETASLEPMSWKRALWYVLATGVLIFGLIVFGLTYYAKGAGLPAALGTLIPFVLPSLLLGAFLIMTEKDRSKPWVVARRKEIIQQELGRFAGNPVEEKRYGLLCGALWLTAVTLFIILSITIGFVYSWLAFAAAVIGQLLIEFTYAKKG